MSLANTSIAQRYAASNNTVDTNTNTNTNTNTMSNIKSIEIVVNLTLKAGGAPTAGYFAKLHSKTNNGMPLTLMTGRSYSSINLNTQEESIYGGFLPLADKVTDRGIFNRAVIVFHYEDGASKILNSKETVRFWEDTVGVTGINGSKLKVQFNLNKAEYDWKSAVAGFKSGRFRSVRIVFNSANPCFRKQIETGEYEKLVLHTDEAQVNLHSKTVYPPTAGLSFRMREDFYTSEDSNEDNDELSFIATTSTKRREGRKAKAQSNAGRKSVKDLQNERQVEATPAAQSSTDAKLDAIMAMVGNLQTQVAELKAENAELRKENEALKAANAEPVTPTPVVDVTPEPVSEPEPEVVEEPAVEETIEESKPAVKSRAAFFAGLNKAKAAKSQAEQNMDEINSAVDEFSMFDDE